MGLVRIPARDLLPAPENERLYRPVVADDPEVIALAKSIRRFGLREPLVVTRDHYVISGHRRLAACKLAGVRLIPCRVDPIDHDAPQFIILLREHNQQRVKTFEEMVREQVISASAASPEEAYSALLEHRRAASAVSADFIQIEGVKTRAAISEAKRPMLEVVLRIIHEQRAYWPLSDRSIHYDVLNTPPLRNAKRPDSRYTNDVRSYKDLCDLLTRARVARAIPYASIEDPTRKVSLWEVVSGVGGFLGKELDGFLKGYWRDHQQSQPNHIEIIGEKNTVEGSIRPVAAKYCIPYTLGRGYCSLDPRYKLLQRFKKSGKSRLILLFLSDFDPEGENIAHSFIRSMRDDFGLRNVDGMKVCLTHEQVQERDLPQTFDIKKDSSRYKQFSAKYGDRAHELESLPSAERSRLLEEAILQVMDVDAYDREVAAEREDAAKLKQLREAVAPALLNALIAGSEPRNSD